MPSILQKLRASFGFRSRSASNWHQMFARDPIETGGGTKLASPLQSAWVFSGVQKITSQLLAAPLIWKRDARGPVVDDAERAAFWSFPGVGVDGRIPWEEFVEASATWILLHGQCSWILDDSFFSGGAPSSAGVVIARPERLRPQLHRGQLLAWHWRDGSDAVHTLLPEQVIRPRIPHPYNDLAGLSPFDAARTAAEADHAAAIFSRNVLESNGDRGAYVIAENVSDEQRAQIEASLKQKRELNRRGIFTLSFLTGNVKVEDPRAQSTDAQFLSNRQANRHEIFAALGIPLSMSEVTVAYSIGAASDRARLLDETCLPLARRLCAAVAEVEARRTRQRLHAALDWSKHSTVQQMRVEQLEKAAAMHARGVPWSTLNQSLELGLEPFPGWDRAWLPMSLQAVDDGEPPSSPEPEPEPEDATPAEELKALIAAHVCQSHSHDTAPPSPPPKTGAPDAREMLWRKHMAARAPAEKVFRKQFSKVLQAARRETLQKIDATKALTRQRGILDLIFDLADFTLRLIEVTRGAQTSALEDAAEQLTLELGLADPWVVPDALAVEHLRERENRIKDAAKHVHEDIKAALEEGLKEQESVAQLGDRVRQAFNAADKERGEMIATTEVGAAYGAARDAGLRAAGIEEKEWLTARDDRVREAHSKADGTHVPVDEDFVIDGEPMSHPGDKRGSAKNVINCRCVLIAHLAR